MQHPFQRIDFAHQVTLAWGFTLATLLVGTGMALLDLPLHTEACPDGIVSFELAMSDAAAQAMIASWSTEARLIAAVGLGFDYLFLLCYSNALAAIAVAASAGWAWGSRFAGPIALAMWLAAGLDAVENAALVRVLVGPAGGPWALIAGVCASVKFALLAVGIPFCFAALLQRIRARRAGA